MVKMPIYDFFVICAQINFHYGAIGTTELHQLQRLMEELVKDEEQINFTADSSEGEKANSPSGKFAISRKIALSLLLASLFILFFTQKQSLNRQRRATSFSSEISVEQYKLEEKLHQNEALDFKNGQIFHSKIQLITHQIDKQKIKQNQREIQLPYSRKQKGGRLRVKEETISLINMLKTNENNKRFGQVAYSADKQGQRAQFLNKRIGMVANPEVHEGLYMSMFNLEIDQALLPYKEALLPIEYQKISKFYNLDKVQEELPICVITPSYNNNNHFRIELSLNSIFTQNYSNYFVAIINDASDDGSQSIFKKYLEFYSIPQERFAFVSNDEHKGALSNIFTAARRFCSEDSIVMSIDGDDELIGKNVFKIFNAEHQRLKAGVIYSNFYYYDQKEDKIMDGFTEEYYQEQKQNNLYRLAPMRFSQLRSFRKTLLDAILEQDLKDENGEFYMTASDMALFFPLLQLCCGRVYKIKGIHYLYNINTGSNDYLEREMQLAKDRQIRKKNPYACHPHFLPPLFPKP